MALGDYKQGDTGPSVATLQGYLADVGISVRRDGVYGPETAAAVKAFQTARRIRVDGIAGPETLIELAKARGEGWTMPRAAGWSDAGSASAAPSTRSTGTSGKTSPKLQPWMAIGAVVLLVWWMSRSKGKGLSGPSRLSVDDFDDVVEHDEPGGDDDDDGGDDDGEGGDE